MPGGGEAAGSMHQQKQRESGHQEQVVPEWFEF
jgi:hypothetical protein